MSTTHLIRIAAISMFFAGCSTPLIAGWTATYLHPTGYLSSYALDASNGRIVGAAFGPAPFRTEHAVMWAGTAASCVDLHPTGSTFSFASSIDGNEQAGCSSDHAGTWSGTAASWVDLDPLGTHGTTFVADCSGGQQVGAHRDAGPVSATHACMWSGTEVSFVDLNPAGCESSGAYGVSGGQQVGEAYGSATGSYGHASLWAGTAASWVDLNPAGCDESEALRTSAGKQAGYAKGTATGGKYHAGIWSGAAASWTDLHGLLSATYTGSRAHGIDAVGEEIWVLGSAYNATAKEDQAVMWHYAPDPVPEPSSLLALSSGILGFCGVIRRRRPSL